MTIPVIQCGPFFFILRPFPESSIYVAQEQAEIEGARIVLMGSSNYFVVELDHNENDKPKAEKAIRNIWAKIFPREARPEVIEGDPRIMLLGKDQAVHLADQSDGYRVWFDKEVLIHILRPQYY
jgi:hypothetical protein